MQSVVLPRASSLPSTSVGGGCLASSPSALATGRPTGHPHPDTKSHFAVRRRLFLDHATVYGYQRDGFDKAPVASNLALIAGQGGLCLLVQSLFRELPHAFPTGGSSFSHVGPFPLSFVACKCSALPSSFVLLPHHTRRPDEQDKTSACPKIAHGDSGLVPGPGQACRYHARIMSS